MAISVITITHDESTASMGAMGLEQSNSKHRFINNLRNYFDGIACGSKQASIDWQLGGGVGVAATAALTLTGLPSANETFVVNGVTFTAKASGATGNQFNIGASATATAAAIAAAVNASSTSGIPGCLTASSASGVVTFTSAVKGTIGNAMTLTESLSNATASGGNFSGGVNASANTFSFGK